MIKKIDAEAVSNPETLAEILSTMRAGINAIATKINHMRSSGGSGPVDPSAPQGQPMVEGPAQLIEKPK